MENTSTDHESDDGSLEEILKKIKDNAFQIDTAFQDVFDKVKNYKDSVDDENALISKPRVKVWLEQRGMSPIVSFQEFFEVFLEEHRQEGRLDLSTRSIDLREDARNLFRPKLKKGPMHFLDFLVHIDQLFE